MLGHAIPDRHLLRPGDRLAEKFDRTSVRKPGPGFRQSKGQAQAMATAAAQGAGKMQGHRRRIQIGVKGRYA
jgi:hypothetical protein